MKGFGLQPDDVFCRAAGKPALHGKNRRTFFVLRIRDAPGFPGILGGEGGGVKLLPPHVGGQKVGQGGGFQVRVLSPRIRQSPEKGRAEKGGNGSCHFLAGIYIRYV